MVAGLGLSGLRWRPDRSRPTTSFGGPRPAIAHHSGYTAPPRSAGPGSMRRRTRPTRSRSVPSSGPAFRGRLLRAATRRLPRPALGVRAGRGDRAIRRRRVGDARRPRDHHLRYAGIQPLEEIVEACRRRDRVIAEQVLGVDRVHETAYRQPDQGIGAPTQDVRTPWLATSP